MTATLTRGEVENLPVDSIFLEMQALKLAHDATVSDFTSTALICLYGVCIVGYVLLHRLVELNFLDLFPFNQGWLMEMSLPVLNL
jgi:hypothetical protein